jgi:hypothetical protein
VERVEISTPGHVFEFVADENSECDAKYIGTVYIGGSINLYEDFIQSEIEI